MADMSKTVDFTRKKLRGADRERFLKLVGAPDAATQAAKAAGGYQVVDGAICRVKATPDGPVTVPLANFSARIVAEEVRDNGVEVTTIFVIEGFLQDGRPLGRAEVSASSYPGMAWVTAAWGTRPVVYAGQGTKDHVRAAIQLLSGEVPRRVTYGHTGWRKLDGCWYYLHAGGAIGPDGAAPTVAVSLAEGRLQDYALPVPPEGEALRRAVRASIGVLKLAPAQVAYPILQAVYRAPLAGALPVDLSLFLAGATGCQKTELTAIAQAHWGPAFHGKHLPGNWDATANALEKAAFLAKDAIFVVDDFAPSGTVADVQRLHHEADRLLRAQGNRSGRVRMCPDGSLRPEYYPRGLIISSGEDIPRGQSLRARLLIIELVKGAVDLAALTQAQADAADGLLAGSMAAYVRWLAPQLDTLKAALPARHRELRAEFRKENMAHDRTPDQAASLAVGWELFLRFAQETGVISEEEAQSLWSQGWRALVEVCKAQSEHQASEDPTGRFVALLGAALTSGHAHVADAVTGKEPENAEAWGWRERNRGAGQYPETEWQPLGDRVGWIDGDDLFLDTDAAFAVVQRLARDQGATIPVTQRVLWKRMAEKGLVLSHDPGTYTTKKTVAGGRPRVLHISGSLIYPGIMGNMGNMGTGQLDQAFTVPRLSAKHGQDAQEYGQRPARQGAGDTKCPYSAPPVPMKSGQVTKTWAPESLAVQGSAQDAHDAHEMGGNSPYVFSAGDSGADDKADAKCTADVAGDDSHSLSDGPGELF